MMIRPVFASRAALIQGMRCKLFRLRWGVLARLWPFLTLWASSGSSPVWLRSLLKVLAPATPQPGSGLGCLRDMFGHSSSFRGLDASCLLSCLGPKAKSRVAKTKPAPRPAGALPLSDAALAGKTIPEKCSLVRWALISFLRQHVGCILSLMSVSEGTEIKKELSALASLKLDLPDLSTRYASFQDSMDKIDHFTQQLTIFFGRLVL